MPKIIPSYRKQAMDMIINSASQLFFEKGYATTSMEDIARSIGVTKGTLYLYFDSKEELLQEVCRRNMDMLKDFLKNLKSENFTDTAREFFEAELNLPDYIKFHWIFALGEMNSNAKIGEIISSSYHEYISILTDKLEELKRKGGIKTSKDPKILAQTLLAFHNGIMMSLMQGLDRKEAISIFIRGLNRLLYASDSDGPSSK